MQSRPQAGKDGLSKIRLSGPRSAVGDAAKMGVPTCQNLGSARTPQILMAGDAYKNKNRLLVELLHGCAQKRQLAFQKLYHLTSPQLFAILMRILKRRDLAEEALQDAFISVWRNAASYTAQKGSPMTWLVSICRYRALDMLRREQREVPLRQDDDEDMDTELDVFVGDSEAGELISHAETRALEQCLKQLSTSQRRSLRLAYFDGLSHAEIAHALRSPVGTVKSWVRRGLQDLKRCLEAT